MTTPEKKEFWIFEFKFGPDESISQNCVVSVDKGASAWLDHVHVVSADWAEFEIERLKKELDDAIFKNSVLCDHLLEAAKMLKVKKV